jgi:hypothetical protein
MSGRASAPLDIDIPAPMVAASASAILNDIDLSSFASGTPFGAVKFHAKPAMPRCAAGFADAFLTARVNQQVTTLALRLI